MAELRDAPMPTMSTISAPTMRSPTGRRPPRVPVDAEKEISTLRVFSAMKMISR